MHWEEEADADDAARFNIGEVEKVTPPASSSTSLRVNSTSARMVQDALRSSSPRHCPPASPGGLARGTGGREADEDFLMANQALFADHRQWGRGRASNAEGGASQQLPESTEEGDQPYGSRPVAEGTSPVKKHQKNSDSTHRTPSGDGGVSLMEAIERLAPSLPPQQPTDPREVNVMSADVWRKASASSPLNAKQRLEAREQKGGGKRATVKHPKGSRPGQDGADEGEEGRGEGGDRAGAGGSAGRLRRREDDASLLPHQIIACDSVSSDLELSVEDR